MEAWLPACLDSIAAQTFTDYELIVIDDGSPDACADIVAERARRDPRITLVRQDNAGLGAARNEALRHAQGELLAFVDGDDEVPPDAWRRMVEVLDRTGSDFVVGRADRVHDDGRRQTTPLMARNHAEDRLAVTLADVPLALADVFAWNKVFRRDFWQRADLAFPEQVRYEDQPALTRAFLLAQRFDLLADVVYLWRVRGDSSSITQRRHELSDLDDRVRTKRWSAGLVDEHAAADVREVFYREVLPIDMWEYFRAGVAADPAYWDLLVTAVRELWHERSVPFERTSVPAQQRLMGWLTVQGRREDLRRWLEVLDAGGGPQYRDGMLVHPWSSEIELPQA